MYDARSSQKKKAAEARVKQIKLTEAERAELNKLREEKAKRDALIKKKKSNPKQAEKQRRLELERTEKERLKALQEQRAVLKNREEYQKKIRSKEEAKKQEEIRKRNTHRLRQSTQSVIPIKDIYKGIVITKDDRYIKIVEFLPQNFHMLPNNKRNLIASGFAGVLENTSYKLQFKVISTKASSEALVEDMKKRRSAEENPMRAQMQDAYIDLVTDTALTEGVDRRFFIIIEWQPTADNDGKNIDSIVRSLNAAAADITVQMNSIGNPPCTIKPLSDTKNLQELFWMILNRRTAETESFVSRMMKVLSMYDNSEYLKEEKKRNIPATDMIAPPWIDYTHPNHVVVCGTKNNSEDGALQNKYYTFAYLGTESYPIHAAAGWMDIFVNNIEGIDCDIFIEPVPSHKVENKIGLQIRMQRSKENDTADTTTESSKISDAIESGEFILRKLGDGEHFYYVSILITICGDTKEEMEEKYKSFKQGVKTSLGANLYRPRYMMEEAFSSALPLCNLNKKLFNRSRHNIMTGGLSTLYPFTTAEMHDPGGIMMGVSSSNASLVSVDVFDTSRHINANGVILGESGSGKTYTANLLAIRWCLQGIQTFIITPTKGKVDYGRACTQIDGQYVLMSPGSPNHINICDIRIPDQSALEDMDEGEGEQISWLDSKVQTLNTFFGLVVEGLTQEELGLLDEYVYKAYAKKGITQDNNSIIAKKERGEPEMPVLSDIVDEVDADIENGVESALLLRKVRNVLRSFCNGPMSTFNKQTNVDLSNKYIVFDLGGKEGESLAIQMFIVLDFVWGKAKENKLEKKAIMIDEAWQLIGAKSNIQAAENVRQIFKLIRAYGGAAFAMTQNVNDFFALDGGTYGTAIVNNSNTKILLKMSKDDCDRMQKILHLSNSDMERVQKFRKGQGLLVTGDTRMFVNFQASPFEHEVMSTDPKELRAKVQARKAMLAAVTAENTSN